MLALDAGVPQERTMDLGVVFPQTEVGTGPAEIRSYIEAAERAGYAYLVVYDHVLGVNPDRPGGWTGRYTHEMAWHEPMVLLGYLAALTRRIGLFTGILILPQRQTALVAKQAAEIDILSGGRLSLGVGVGWIEVEYEGLNQDFHNRGRRIEEQIEVMRELWAQTSIDFKGRYHRIANAGINPLPAHTIPIWIGGGSELVLDRTGRLADGWMIPPDLAPGDLAAPVARIREAAVAAGRDPSTIGLEARISVGTDVQEAVAAALAWRDAGVTQLSIRTMWAARRGAAAHIQAIEHFKRAYDEATRR